MFDYAFSYLTYLLNVNFFFSIKIVLQILIHIKLCVKSFKLKQNKFKTIFLCMLFHVWILMPKPTLTMFSNLLKILCFIKIVNIFFFTLSHTR